MIVVTGAIGRQASSRGLRPFKPTQDLDRVAELLHVAFREELGRRETAWLQEMQTLAVLKPVIWFLDQVNVAVGRLLHGFVWVEEGDIVGNVTLSRLSVDNWLVSNVAVHPDHRRRGIGRELMAASVEWLRERGVRWVTLEVRRDNEAAKALYFDLDFVLVDGTTEMERRNTRAVTRSTPPENYRLRPAQPADGPSTFELARRVTPELAQEIEPLDRGEYEIGALDRVMEGLGRLVGLPATMRWVMSSPRGELVARLKVRAGGYDHRIEMLVHPVARGVVEETLVTRALDALSGRRGTIRAKIDADYPAAIDTLREYGFHEVRTLDRMALDLKPPRRIPMGNPGRGRGPQR